MKPLLTIGYPTYGRADAVEAAVGTALRHIDGLPIELLVADDGSPDDTVERLTRRFGDSSLRLIAGEQNLGWKGNIARLAKNASSEFLMLLSDEDDVAEASVLSELLTLLSGTRRLSLVSTGAGLVPADPGQLRAENVWEGVHYISGNIFRTSEVLKWLELLEDIQHEHDVAELWEIYPHYMMAVGIWLSGEDCAHFPGDVYVSTRKLPMRWRPAHRELGDRELARTRQEVLGKAYLKSMSSNILQHASLATYVDVLEDTMAVDKARVSDMRRWQEDRVAKQVDALMAYYYPELYPTWRRGIRRRHSMRRRLAAGVRHLLRLPAR